MNARRFLDLLEYGLLADGWAHVAQCFESIAGALAEVASHAPISEAAQLTDAERAELAELLAYAAETEREARKETD